MAQDTACNNQGDIGVARQLVRDGEGIGNNGHVLLAVQVTGNFQGRCPRAQEDRFTVLNQLSCCLPDPAFFFGTFYNTLHDRQFRGGLLRRNGATVGASHAPHLFQFLQVASDSRLTHSEMFT